MRKLICLYIFCLTLLSCTQTRETPVNHAITLDILNPQWANFNDLVADVECIRLESSPDAMLSDCYKIIRNKDRMYIHSLFDYSVYVFGSDGKFIRKIGKGGKDALEMPTDILVNEASGQLYISYRITNQLNIYNQDGEYLQKQELPVPTAKMINYKDSAYLFYGGNSNRNSDYHVTLCNLQNPDKKEEFVKKPKNAKRNMYTPATLFAKDEVNNNIYSYIPDYDTIYYSNPQENIPFKACYSLNTGGQLLTNDKYPEKGFTDAEFSEIINQNKYIWNIHSLYYAANKLFFRLRWKDSYYCALQTKDNTLLGFKTLFDGLNVPGHTTSIQGSSGNKLYIAIKASSLLEQYAHKKPSFKNIEDTISRLKSDDNWVVMLVTLK